MRGDWWWKAAVLGLLNIGGMPLLFLAAERLPGGVAATLGAAQPLLVTGLAVAVLRDRPTAWRLTWAVLGAASDSSCSVRRPDWTPSGCSPASAIRPPWPAGSWPAGN
ncbi:hypothetical protein GCM10010317_043130 [Streptomyces mirabilis]|nr:hypothetical protein GCM10010317_043130 [Streptomyces mirabilis]